MSSEITFDDPCVLFALRRESKPFLQEFRPNQRFAGAPCWAKFSGPAWLSILALETGIGPAPVHAALDWLLNSPVLENVPYKPKVVISAGFAGALQAEYQVGDLILATEVADLEGNTWPTTWPGELPPGEWKPPLHRARLLSTPRPIVSPEEKKSLGQLHQAAAVDMESAVLAKLCSQHEVPFGCVRAISDTVGEAISPNVIGLLSGSGISPVRLITTVLRSPGVIGELRRLARQTRHASRQLGTALGELLTLTLEWNKET